MKHIPIKGLELYLISDDGVVHSYHKNKHTIRKWSIKKGYQVYGLMLHGKVKWFLAHRLVALTYIPNQNNHYAVNHIDGNKLNNHVSNLEWVNRLQNAQHAASTGLYKTKGNHGRARMVLNTQTGIYYDTVTDAALSSGKWSRNNLNPMLTGWKKNITPFIYA